MSKKENNKKFSKDREFAVILEKIYSEIKIISEGQSALRERVDTLYEEFARQREEIFIIKADINVIKSEIKEIKIRLDNIEARLKEDLKVFHKRLTQLETAK